jgi:hypothetical protein
MLPPLGPTRKAHDAVDARRVINIAIEIAIEIDGE